MSDYKDLCCAVEQKTGRTYSASSDFKWLSDRVLERTNELLSTSTLMRLWGYRKGVTPRKATLDIVARYLGYRGYDDFCQHQAAVSNKQAGTEILAEGSPVERTIGNRKNPDEMSEKRPRRWSAAVAAVVAVIALIAGGVYFLNRPPQPVYITDLSQLSNNKQYIIHTRNDRRGALGVKNRFPATSFQQALYYQCEQASPFAIIQYNGSYFLFSVQDRRFIGVTIHETDAPLAYGEPGDCALDIHQESDSCFVIDFKTCKTVCTLNVNSNNGLIITNYGTINGLFDDGNMFMLEEVGDFDPTEALAMLQEPNAEYEAARAAVPPGRYAIYTLADGTGKEGTVCRYIKADGYLTETFSDSCIFTIQVFEQYDQSAYPYRLPAWGITFQTAERQEVDTAETAFGVPPTEEDVYVPRMGHLHTLPSMHDSWQNAWQDKVFFLGSNGCYAIRATNVPYDGYGAGLYWAVCDRDGDGRPKADYSYDRAYIWKLMKK